MLLEYKFHLINFEGGWS